MFVFVGRKIVAVTCFAASFFGFYKLSEIVGGSYGEYASFYRNVKRFAEEKEKIKRRNLEAQAEEN